MHKRANSIWNKSEELEELAEEARAGEKIYHVRLRVA